MHIRRNRPTAALLAGAVLAASGFLAMVQAQASSPTAPRHRPLHNGGPTITRQCHTGPTQTICEFPITSPSEIKRDTAKMARDHAAHHTAIIRRATSGTAATTASDPLQPSTIPTYCFTAFPENQFHSAWYGYVENGCYRETDGFAIYQEPNHVYQGSIAVQNVVYSWTPNTKTTWFYNESEWEVVSESKQGLGGTFSIFSDPANSPACSTITEKFDSPRCSITQFSFPRQSMALSKINEAYLQATTTPQSGSAAVFDPQWGAALSTTQAVNGGTIDISGPFMACDNALLGYPAGCRANYGTGHSGGYLSVDKFSLTNSTYAAVSKHIQGALRGGAPSTLSRTDNSTGIASANRSFACGSSKIPSPRPTGYQCDEYPFASSREGGWDGTKTLFTESFCNLPKITATTGDVSACLVPTSANTAAGSQLSAFYNSQRILTDVTQLTWGITEGSAFHVYITA